MEYIHSEKILNSYIDYITISYVWEQFPNDSIKQAVFDMWQHIKIFDTDTIAIWLDIVSNQTDDETKKLIYISSMARIYHSSKYTIVFLPECDEISDIKTEKTLFYNIFTSKWMTRAWTLQEQMVSENLVLYSKGKFFRITEQVRLCLMFNYIGVKKKWMDFMRDMYLSELVQQTECIIYKGDKLYEYVLDAMSTDVYNKINNLCLRASIAKLSEVEAINLASRRVMGADNISIEPILGMIDYNEVPRIDGYMRIDPYILVNKSVRSGKENLCWLPTRLNYESVDNYDLDIILFLTPIGMLDVRNVSYNWDYESGILRVNAGITNNKIVVIILKYEDDYDGII